MGKAKPAADARYAVLSEPAIHGKHPNGKKKKSSACCRCCCCCCCCLFLTIFILIVAVILFSFYLNPKIPSYSVKDLDIAAFNISSDLKLKLNMSVTVRAENPNRHMGIYYGEKSRVQLSYEDTELCSGKLPEFYQGHENVTMLKITMDGEPEFGAKLQADLAMEQMKEEIPLDLHVEIPIKLRLFDKVDANLMTFIVDCKLVVDNFQPGKKTAIKSAHYDVQWKYQG